MTELWIPLSERENAPASALRDGVPVGLERPLRNWIEDTGDSYSTLVDRVAVRCDLGRPTRDGYEDNGPSDRLAYGTSTDQLLDIVDALLDLVPTGGWQNTLPTPGLPKWQAVAVALASTPDTMVREPLQRLLDDARSLYTVRMDGRALVRRMDPAVASVLGAAAETAERPDRGSAARHLRQAFEAAYALKPDPVKAYSEAIKAVEAAAHATLQPNHVKATLGTMLGELRQARHKLGIPIAGPNGTEGVAAIETMMELLWTGQTSRHGNLQVTRDETVAESLMAVHLAATLVQLFASGAVSRS